MEDLHWTQLNLLLLSNFYKQIHQAGREPSLDELNCGGCSKVFPVSALTEYIYIRFFNRIMILYIQTALYIDCFFDHAIC